MIAEYMDDPAPPTAGTEYMMADHLGSTRAVLDAATNTLSCHDYLPFGEELTAGRESVTCYNNPDAVKQKFTGKERDTETGLDYYGARYLSGAMARWISPDWSDKSEPVPYADLNDPQTLNLYGFVRNNPYSYVDRDGHQQALLDAACKAGASSQCIPPPPPPPLPPPVNTQAVLQSLDNLKVNTLTVAETAKILTRESRDVTASSSTQLELANGKVATASAIMNGDEQLGANRPQTADKNLPTTLAASPQHQENLQLTREVFFDRRVHGHDIAGGRIYFGNSGQELNSRPVGAGRQTVHERYGPFSVGPRTTFIYNDPIR